MTDILRRHNVSIRAALVVFTASAAFLLSAAGDSLLIQARSGDPDSQFRLASEYFSGRNRNVNPVLAVYWFRRAADAGHAASQFNLGRCFEKGWGCSQSFGMALKYYSLAMQKRVPEAVLCYAELLYRGIPEENNVYGKFPPLKADPAKALELMRQAAEVSPQGKLILAKYLFRDAPQHGKELRQLLEEYIKLPRPHHEALLLYASCLRSGIGGELDIPLGMEMLQRAAGAGNHEAAAQLAEVLLNGNGLPPNPAEALELTRRAADAGNPRAMYNLANAHLAGLMVEYDISAAFKLFSRAAGTGYPPALRRLGDCFAHGMGCEQNFSEALENYRAAAVAGDEEACCLLGNFYAEGKGTGRDDAAAFYWYSRAAQLGSAKGMRKMAVALLDGRGVRKNRARGMEILRRAAALGDRIAGKLLQR